MTIDAVIFDWGGTLTPWHTVDLKEQWTAYAQVYDPLRADELAGCLLGAETAAWARARDHQRSGTIGDLLREAGIDPSGERHEAAMVAYHEAVFRRDGVLDLIDGGVYTSEIEWTKPHPEAFRAAMAAVDVDDPAHVVFVGDRPYDDVHGAKEVGMRAVLVPHSAIPDSQKGHVEGDPDAVVDRLGDVLAVVDGWAEGD